MVDTTAFKKDPPYTICFSNASVANDWRVAMVGHVDYAIEEAKGKGLIKDYFYADANNDPNKQISDIEDLLTKGCDVMIISAAAQDVVDPGAKQAMDAGVPVITLDRDVLNPENRVGYVDGDSCLMGSVGAEWLVEELGGKGDIVLLSGIAGASPAEERLRCARRVEPPAVGCGDASECARLQAQITDLCTLHTHGHWLPALKAACAMLGLGNGIPSPPLLPAGEAERRAIESILARHQLISTGAGRREA